MRIAPILLACFVLIFSGCALPRIIVLKDPLNAYEYNDLGISYEAAGKMDQALDAYAMAAQKNQSWDQPLLNCGNVYAAQNLWTKAEACYRQALQRNPDNPETMNNLACALLAQNQPIKALFLVDQALDQDPDNLIFQTTRAQALAQTGQRNMAQQILRDILSTLPATDPLYQQISALYEQLTSPAP